MPNPNRFASANVAIAQANTKLILTLLATAPRTITEIQVATGLTRVTIDKRLKANANIIKSTDTRPAKFYIGDSEQMQTLVEEITAKEAKREAQDHSRNMGEAIQKLSGLPAVGDYDNLVFFPAQSNHNDLSRFHDSLMDEELTNNELARFYRRIQTKKNLDDAIHAIRTMHDVLMFRKKELKEFN